MVPISKTYDIRHAHAEAIAAHGTLTKAIAAGALPSIIDSTLSELIVLGLLRQGVGPFSRFLVMAQLKSVRSCGFTRNPGW